MYYAKFNTWLTCLYDNTKGIGGSTLIFRSSSYFIEFCLSYQTLLTAWKNSKFFLRYERSKLVASIGSYERRKLKTQKKTISLKIYLLLHFLTNLLQIFTESVLLNLKRLNAGIFETLKNKTFIKKTTYFFLIYIFLFFNIFKIPTFKVL